MKCLERKDPVPHTLFFGEHRLNDGLGELASLQKASHEGCCGG